MAIYILSLLIFFTSTVIAQDTNTTQDSDSQVTIAVDPTNDTPIHLTIPKTLDTYFSDENTDKSSTILHTDSRSAPKIFQALIKAYPDIVKSVSPANNPLFPTRAISIRGTNFYDINGRFLPESEKDNWKKYSSNSVYIYAKNIPDPKARTKEEIKQMKLEGSKGYRAKKKPTHYLFNETLYGMSSLADTNTQIVKTRFMKRQVLVHQFAYKPLMEVEKEIYKLTNHPQYGEEVRKFLKEGDTVYSFFWRNIAGSKSRSLHSYGVAIDILDSSSNKATYWLWRQNLGIDWITEPISVRWNPPNSVVEIFEKYGFVWGGKWNFYDTMHFEYKPEILLLNDYKVKFIR